jgi:hypothetical protein
MLGSGKADLAVKREGSCAVNGQHDSQCGEGKDVVVDSEALVDADKEERNQHVDRNQCCDEACEQTENKQDAAGELDVGRDIAEPIGDTEGGDVVGVVIKRAMRNNFSITVNGHRDAECKAHQECTEGLQAVEPVRHKNLSGFKSNRGVAASAGETSVRVPRKARGRGRAREVGIDRETGRGSGCRGLRRVR